MCKVICVCNQKGGTAKSTTVCNLGAGLVRAGKKVLCITCSVDGLVSSCQRASAAYKNNRNSETPVKS